MRVREREENIENKSPPPSHTHVMLAHIVKDIASNGQSLGQLVDVQEL